jgi:hypothetical protein
MEWVNREIGGILSHFNVERSHLHGWYDSFFAFAESGKRKYWKNARREVRKLEAFVKLGAVNCTHKALILRAEFGAIDTRGSLPLEKVKELFEKALAASTRSAFMHDSAMAAERIGKHMLTG